MKKVLLVSFLLLLSAAATTAFVIHYQLNRLSEQFLEMPLPLHFEVAKGDSVYSIAHKLHKLGLLDSVWDVKLLSKFDLLSPKIHVGEYTIDQRVTLPDLFALFTKGDVITYNITFPEGWDLKQIGNELHGHDKLRVTIESYDSKVIADLIGSESESAEGWVFPDTYQYVKGDSDAEILLRAYNKMRSTLDKEWSNRDKTSLSSAIETPYDALILASLIEKESSVGSERELISSVFHNRLKLNMRLQTDPTVIYALGDKYDGNIRRSDLKFDSPFNTYVYKGLPPTPIAMPGYESIKAALHPKTSKYLFFVAKGNGFHQFSETLQQHNKAVRNYQIQRRAKSYRSTPK